MESMKDKISSWLKYFKDYINSFSFVEKEKNIFYFSKFSLDISEFYLIHEFVKTLKENIFKKNIEQFRYCLNNVILLDKDKTSSEKEKIIILYSACLFIYYKKFRYNINCTFENYFDAEFIQISKNIFKFEIKNNELFKIFAFYFFSIIQKQIIALDYTKIQKLGKYYNYRRVENNNEEEEMEIEISNGSSEKMNEEFQAQVLTFLISAKEKIIDLVFETSDKNQINNLNLFPNEINDMNNRFQKLNNMYFESNDKNEENKNNVYKNINQINIKKAFDNSYENSHNDNKSEMNSEDCSPQKPKAFNVNKNRINIINNNINNQNNNSMNTLLMESDSNFLNYMRTDCSNKKNNNKINDNSMSTNINNISKKNTDTNNSGNFNNTNSTINNLLLNDSLSVPLLNNLDSILNTNNFNDKRIKHNTYSKRIIGELVKSEFDNKTMEIIEEVSKIIDLKYLDKFLNDPSKTVTMIQYFCCYVVEFTPEMLQNICPKHKDVLKNFGIKLIVLAKELYNTTMEIFSTIYDLSYTNFDTFIDLTKECGIKLKHAQGLYKIFRDFSITLYNEKKKKGGNKNIMNVLRKLFEQENLNWRGIIKQKANEFTNFYKIFYE